MTCFTIYFASFKIESFYVSSLCFTVTVIERNKHEKTCVKFRTLYNMNINKNKL